ncbi:MAG: DegV family protein [Chloroflexi bacterium]|nr:DegV family protein [Chloroflexota bacterium]
MTTNAGAQLVLVTDAGCDLSTDMFKKYDIRIAPLKILFGDEVYQSGVDITHEQFYERLARGDVHPTTSQPTVAEFVEMYQELGTQGKPILSLHLSEGLSGTVNVARQAANQLPDLDITVHDCGTLSSALGLQVLTAARAAAAGRTIDEILPILKQTHEVANLLFSVEDLSYLYKGGRIGTVRYQVGQALRIKPVVTVCKTGDKAGTYIPAGRVRSLAKAADFFIDQITEAVGAGNKLRAISLYGDDPTLAQQMNARLTDMFDCVYLDMVPTAPVLGVHVGPGALGISYAPGDWPV